MAKPATKTAMIRARTEPAVKRGAEKVLRTMGLTPTAAITMFYRQIILHRGLPFRPNATTLAAMRDAERGENLVHSESAEDFLAELKSDDE
jgi:DNA-damage-inducible protein J